MKAATVVLLSRPADSGERRRFRLIALATMVSGGLLIAAAGITQLGAADSLGIVVIDGGWYTTSNSGGFAPYVAQPGLRVGTVLATVLLTVPLLALAVQALRVGSLARDRRMASLRLAGATPAEVRMIAAAEAGGAAVVGGLLAGPVYVVLALLLGALLPFGWRLLPSVQPIDAVVWAVVVVVSGACGAVAGALVQSRAVVEPLGVRRRAAEHRSPRLLLVGLIGGPVVAVVGMVFAVRHDAFWVVIPPIIGVLMFVFALAPVLARFAGGRLARRGTAEHLLAGRRIAADPSSSGRVIGVLTVCGLALGFEAILAAEVLAARGHVGGTLSFYFAGYAMAAASVLAAAWVAVFTLVVGYGDQLLDARRPLASLSALGVEEPALARVLRLQISAASVPAVVGGVLAGGVGAGLLLGIVGGGFYGLPALGALIAMAVPLAVVAVLAGLAVSLAARLAARLLRSRLREALDPENLRVA